MRFIDSWTLQEISLCERPANPDCLDAVEILGGTRIHRKLLVPKAAEQVATEPRLVEVSTHTPIRDPETGRISSSISVKRIGNGDLVELTTSTPVWDDAVGKGQRIKTIIVVKEVVAATEELGQLRDYAANLEARPRKVL